MNRINARGNLDIRITDFLSVAADVAARIEKKDWGAKDGEGLFGEISTLRSNEYPFIISPEAINGHDGIAVDGSSLILEQALVNQAIFIQIWHMGGIHQKDM